MFLTSIKLNKIDEFLNKINDILLNHNEHFIVWPISGMR